MKKYLLVAVLAFVMMGCEQNGVEQKSKYKIAGKAYKHITTSDSFDVYRFKANGECDVDYYFDNV